MPLQSTAESNQGIVRQTPLAISPYIHMCPPGATLRRMSPQPPLTAIWIPTETQRRRERTKRAIAYTNPLQDWCRAPLRPQLWVLGHMIEGRLLFVLRLWYATCRSRMEQG